MGIVARDATEPAIAGLEAAAGSRLFNLTHGASRSFGRRSRPRDKNDGRFFQSLPRSEIAEIATVSRIGSFPLQVTLGADILTTGGVESGRVNNRIEISLNEPLTVSN